MQSWLVAQRLSVCNRRIHPDVIMGAQSVAAVIATRLAASDPRTQIDDHALMRRLEIKDSA
jgi:hypothetical protein